MSNMSLIAFAAIALQNQATPDPMRLPIGRPGEAVVQPGSILDLRSLKTATRADVAASADSCRFVFVGEEHDNPKHHQMQADIIQALVERGRSVIVGFEMFQRPIQPMLNPWTLGWWTEDEFIQKADWKHQWGMDYALYRPIFETIKKDKLPMVALNIPRDWVHTVGTKGYDALNDDQKGQLVPSLDLQNRNHKKMFEAMMEGHPAAPNMYAAQVLWDTAMADSAIKYLDSHVLPSNTVLVIVAGAGHGMYGQGINYRLGMRNAGSCLNLICVTGKDGPVTVSRGIGDYVYCN